MQRIGLMPKLRGNDPSRVSFLLAAFFFVVVFASGVGVVDSVGVAAALVIQVAVGMAVLPASVKTASHAFVRQIGLGLAVGSAFTSIFLQMTRLFFPFVSQTVLLGLLAGLLVIAWWFAPPASTSGSGFAVSEQVWLVLFGATFVLGLAQGWHFASFLALCLGLPALFQSKVNNERSHRFTIGSLLVGLAVALGFRIWADFSLIQEIIWDGDNSIFQLISNTLQHWGVGENAGSIGQASFSGYHWATFSWLSTLESVTNMPAWDALQIAVPTVVSVGVAALFVDLVFELLGGERRAGLATILVLVGLALSFRPEGSFSLYVTDLWLIALIVFLALSESDYSHTKIVCFSILFLAVYLGKRTSGVVVLVAIVFTLALFVILRDRRSKDAAKLVVAAFIGVGLDQAIQLLVVTLGDENLRDLLSGEGRVFFNFVSESAFGFAGSIGGVRSVLLAFVVSITIFGPYLFSALLLSRHLLRAQMWMFISGFTLLTALLMPFVIDGEVLAVYYYVRHPGKVTAAAIVLAVLASPSCRNLVGMMAQRFSFMMFALIFGGSVLVWIVWTYFPLDYVNIPSGYVDTFRMATWIPALVFALGLTRFARVQSSMSSIVVISVLFFGLLAALPKTFDEVVNERVKPLILGSHENQLVDFPSRSIEEIGVWAVSETNVDDVFASNLFCDDNQWAEGVCEDPDWWSQMVSEAKDGGYFEKKCRDGSPPAIRRLQNYLLPSVTDRRFLIQGPNMSTWCDPDATWVPERIYFTEMFARDPDQESCKVMIANQVKFMVVDKRTTERTTWEPYAQIAKSTADLVALRVRPDAC